MISAILQAIVAIPQIVKMVYSLIKTIKEMAEKSKRDKLDAALKKAAEAKTLEELKKINDEITRNLP